MEWKISDQHIISLLCSSKRGKWLVKNPELQLLLKLRTGQLSWRRAMQHGAQSLPGNFWSEKICMQICHSCWLGNLSQTGASWLPREGQDAHTIPLCSDLCTDSRSKCTLPNHCKDSWPTSAPQLEKEEGYLSQPQATAGYRDPLYAPPHTSLLRSNTSNKKRDTMHKCDILHLVIYLQQAPIVVVTK